MEKKWDEVFNYLSSEIYPGGYNKSQKQSLRKYASKFEIKGGELWCGRKRALKNIEDAKNIFAEFHLSPIGGHTGVIKTRNAISSRFYWSRMTVDIENWISECDKCQKVGKPLIIEQKLECIQVSAVWELVGIDLFGPLPKTEDGFQYILTATDYFSKWVEAFPLRTKTACEVAKQLCHIIYRHGCPKRILSDQGREFVNEINYTLCEMLQIKRSVTAAYHPQTNGLDEKTNDNIKRALKKLVNEQQNDWDTFLEATVFSLRSKVHTTTKHSPFYLMYGREAVFPSEVPVDMPITNIMFPQDETYSNYVESKEKERKACAEKVKENVEKSQEKQKRSYAKRVHKKYKNITYSVGDEVLLLNTRKIGRKGGRMEPDFSGPYLIQSISGKLAILKHQKGNILKTKYSIDHLKPYKRSLDTTNPTTSGQQEQICSDIPPTHVQQTAEAEYLDDGPKAKRPSVIVFNTKNIQIQEDSGNVTTESAIRKPANTLTENTRKLNEEVVKMWASKDCGQVEAVVGPYKLFDCSFRTLQGAEWLSDEVIDAYLHHLVQKQKIHVHVLCVASSTSLFSGLFGCLRKMRFPLVDVWICPVNFGSHWMLMIVRMTNKVILMLDPLGQEKVYERKILKNWRNFLKLQGYDENLKAWQGKTLHHQNQKDASSCGVLILKYAEMYLANGKVDDVSSCAAAVSLARMEIASTLLTYRGHADDYCVVCCMMECNDKSSIEMLRKYIHPLLRD